MSRRAGAALVGAGLLLGLCRPAAAQQPPAGAGACPPAVDTVVDTLFSWVPRQRRDEPLAVYEFRNVQERTAAGMVMPIPLLGARNAEPGWRDATIPSGAEHLAQAEAVVWFQLRDDGRLTGMRVDRRSGWSALDVALQRAILRADSMGAFDSLPRPLAGHAMDLFVAAGFRRRPDAVNTPIARVARRLSVRPCQP